MASVVLGGQNFEIDEQGFIQNPDLWTEAVATDLAKLENVPELTENHWRVVRYVRDYYLQNKIAPMVRKMCKETNFKLAEIYDMFPSGPANGACKIAGLPKPTGCV